MFEAIRIRRKCKVFFFIYRAQGFLIFWYPHFNWAYASKPDQTIAIFAKLALFPNSNHYGYEPSPPKNHTEVSWIEYHDIDPKHQTGVSWIRI